MEKEHKKEEKKDIELKTVIKAVITGYVAYGILLGFVAYVVCILVNWAVASIPNINDRGLVFTLSLAGIIFLYAIVRGICKLSIHDVFKKCKTKSENLPKIITRLNLFILICIVFFIVSSILIMLINFSNQQKSIEISSYQYKAIHSEAFSAKLTNEMIRDFENNRTNTIISTVIFELGMTVSLFSVIPLQKKLITEENEG